MGWKTKSFFRGMSRIFSFGRGFELDPEEIVFYADFEYARVYTILDETIEQTDPHMGIYDRQKLVVALIERGVKVS